MKKQLRKRVEIDRLGRANMGLRHLDLYPLPSLAEAHRRIWSRPSFFASLSAETRAALAEFDHPEVIGPPAAKRDW